MIRIIAGKYKNRKLKSFKLENVRPTQSRVRKSMFDTLHYFNNKNVLDLFCGVGTLGIESLSRGAKFVTFVDNHHKSISTLKNNLNLLSILNSHKVINSDVFKFLKKCNKKYDIIFADPPYNQYKFIDFFPLISDILCNDGVFCFESNLQNVEKDIKVKIKHIGDTQLIFWRKNE